MEIIYTTVPEFLESLFGHYTPITYLDSAGNSIIPSGFSGVDWTYICSVGLFVVVVYSLFRIIGGLICRNY